MGRKKNKGASINLDSFLDIMTCLVGILVLIIILTGVDASQIKVLIPTPIQNRELDANPIFIEARNNELFLIPLDELREMASKAMRDISEQANGQMEKVLALTSTTEVKNDIYSIDLTQNFAGQLAIYPIQTSKGYSLKNYLNEDENGWLGKIIGGMDKEREMLTFLVRDDSFQVFKHARAVAWSQKVQVSWELLSHDEPIKFGMFGSRSLAQ